MATVAKKTGQRLLGMKDVLERLRMSRSQLNRLISRGVFPKPRRHQGCTMIVWLESEVDQYIEGLA